MKASDAMDGYPFIEDINESIKEVIGRVIEREPDKIYDHVVVTDDGKFVGSIPMHRLMEKLNIVSDNGLS